MEQLIKIDESPLLFTKKDLQVKARKTVESAIAVLNAIEIKDEGTIKIATQRAKELSDSIKAVDDLRKSLNAPEQTRIDERMDAFKTIFAGAKEAVDAIKSRAAKVSAAIQAEKLRKAQEELAKANAEKARIQEIQDKLLSYSQDSMTALTTAHTVNDLNAVGAKYNPNINIDWKEFGNSLEPQFKATFEDAVAKFKEAGKERLKQIQALALAKSKEDKEAIKADMKETVAEIENARTEVSENIVLNTNHASDKAGKDAALAQKDADKKIGGISTRKVLDCEIVNEGEVPRRFMSFDKDKTLDWGKTTIEGLAEPIPAEGKVYAGVRFFYKDVNVLR